MARFGRSRASDLWNLAHLVGIILFFALMAAYIITFTSTKSQCLSKGYTKGEVDFAFNTYCIRRQDQTDVVVPLDKATQQNAE